MFNKLLIAVLMVIGLLVATSADTAQADHNRWLPNQPTTVQLRVLSRGYGIYCINENAAAYPNWKSQLQEVYANEKSTVGIEWRESTTGKDCDIQHLLVTGAQFPCGAGAAACIYYFNDPVSVYYNRDLLYSDWKTTIGHEHGHWDGSHERYIDSNGQIMCGGQKYTRNDCASGVWWVTDYDLAVAWNTLVPDRPLTANLSRNGSWIRLSWDNNRADCAGLNLGWSGTNFQSGNKPGHMTCKNDVALGMDFLIWRADIGYQWVGNYCGAAAGYCQSNYRDYERSFDAWWSKPGTCFYGHAYNNGLWWVSPASGGYWFTFGCI